MSNENDTEADLMTEYESLQRGLEKNKKAIDKEVEILRGKIEEMTEDEERE